MQIYEALKKDHDALKPLLARLVISADESVDERRSLIAKIRNELIPHSRAEEAVLYNSLREIPETSDLAWHGYGEHAEAEAMLRTLQVMDKVNADYTIIAKKLQDALLHHISEEEGKIFSAAKQVLAKEEAEMMTTAFMELKGEVEEQSFMQNTLDMVANMMPARFQEKLRSFNHNI